MAAPDIPALLQQLRSHSTSTQFRAAKHLSQIAIAASADDAIAAAGGMGILLRLLRNRSEAVQAVASAAIFTLTRRSQLCCRSFVEDGGVEVLIALVVSSKVAAVVETGLAILASITLWKRRPCCSSRQASGS